MSTTAKHRADIFVIADAILITAAAIIVFMVYKELISLPPKHATETARLVYKATDIVPIPESELNSGNVNLDEVMLRQWSGGIRDSVKSDAADTSVGFYSPLKRFSEFSEPKTKLREQAFIRFSEGDSMPVVTPVQHSNLTGYIVQGPVYASQDCKDCVAKGVSDYKKGDVIGVREAIYGLDHGFAYSAKMLLITLCIMAIILLVTSLFLLPAVRKSQDDNQSMTERATSAEKQALTDPLTGLPNRRYFEHSISGFLREFGKLNKSFGLMMLDIDHFKSVNDNFGHDVGDMVLQEVALRLKAVCREHDVIARFGGEEFAIITPYANPDMLNEIAERFRFNIESLQINVGNTILRPTVSIGVAVSTPEMRDIHELFQNADQKLYEAKNAGRNRIAA